MIELPPAQRSTLRHWFQPERPGSSLVGPHVVNTGCGTWHADRWPDPRLILAEVHNNYTLCGDPAAFPVDDPPPLSGFVDAPADFLPVLQRAYDRVHLWPRVLFRLDGPLRPASASPDATIRRLTAQDAPHVAALPPDAIWIARPWDDAAGLAASGYAWGAFVEDTLASVSCSFFVGESYEELGVVTVDGYYGRGYSTACTEMLCRDVLVRGRIPTWSTTPDNLASVRVAEKLGFAPAGEGMLYVVNMDPPVPV